MMRYATTALYFGTLLLASGDLNAAGQSPAAAATPVAPAAPFITATGIGYPPKHMSGTRARLMARRAAEVDAMRNLAAKLGLPQQTRLGPFLYVSERDIAGGGVEVTVQSKTCGSAPPCSTPARPKCVPRPNP